MSFSLKPSILAICTFPIFLTACNDTGFVVEPFSAKYYTEDDGRAVGQGTDGSDPSIIPVLMHEETVSSPSLNFPYDYEFGIDSYNFYGEWESEILVYDDTEINANFDISWSDVSFYVDDELISKWSNSKKVIPLNLDLGVHKVKIEYHNHWHTTGFNVSFTNYEKTTVSETISDKISASAQISYIGAYEPSSTYNEVIITLPESDSPQVLFLTSYNSINWVIDNPHDTELEGVIFKSYAPGSNISNADSAFIYEATDLSRGYNDFTAPTEDIISMTNRAPDYVFGQYSISDIELPAVFTKE